MQRRANAGGLPTAEQDPLLGEQPPGLERLLTMLAQAADPQQAGRLARAAAALGEAGTAGLRELLETYTAGRGGSIGPACVPGVARVLLELEDPYVDWAALASSERPTCRMFAARGLQRTPPAWMSPQQVRAALQRLAGDTDQRVAWLARLGLGQPDQDSAGRAARKELRLTPHFRASLPSAQPPYGLPPPGPGEGPGPGPLPLALAAFNLSISTNLGVLLRSAEAAGVREVFIVGDPRYHPGAARGVDRHLLLRWVRDAAELLQLADAGGYGIVAIQQSREAVRYDLAEHPPRPLFVLGAEAAGLPPELTLAADLLVEIPMVGRIDSLNVATAGTIVLFDWLRRQGFPHTMSAGGGS